MMNERTRSCPECGKKRQSGVMKLHEAEDFEPPRLYWRCETCGAIMWCESARDKKMKRKYRRGYYSNNPESKG